MSRSCDNCAKHGTCSMEELSKLCSEWEAHEDVLVFVMPDGEEIILDLKSSRALTKYAKKEGKSVKRMFEIIVDHGLRKFLKGKGVR